MTNTETPEYNVSPLDPARGWVRPERAFSTLNWVEDSLPFVARRVYPRALSRRRYDSMMDLVAAGLVERRNYVRGAKDGLAVDAE